ncbi:MAG TPA: sulfate ABC transporter ATP-binding protein [Gemmatimonadaceae bacterium]|nr:sulfate ABC transporter ATP-binding protein [Gemmatimonadaceae bacterium]
MSVELDRVSKQFGEFTALDQVSFAVGEGELVALVGPSGSGKSTLLRVVAGLERQDAGTVRIHGEDAAPLGPGDRRIGFVFQHYALFRHMTVFENVAFGLRVRPRRERPSGSDIKAAVKDLLALVELDTLGARYPSELSGGQQQRVALARALAVQPRVLLLDEPFGALDARVRKQLRQWLRRLHDEVQVTTILVTHDSEEACEVADRVAVMHDARIAQIGTAAELARGSANPFLESFLAENTRKSAAVKKINYH